MNKPEKKVLFLCIANTCRSQIAEGYLREMGGDKFKVFSAGLKPSARIHPLAVEVMKMDGIDISAQKPKGVDRYLGRESFSTIIVVCKQAHEMCPVMWPGLPQQKLLYWPVEDPVKKEEEDIQLFIKTREDIKKKIKDWLTSM